MKKLNILLIAGFILAINNVNAQGWLKQKGEGYFKLGINAIVASDFYGPNGNINTIRTTSIYNYSLYAEYGLSKKFTLITYVPFWVRNTLNAIEYRQSGRTEAADFSNAFGDTDIALKYGLIKDKPLVLSATLLLGLPLGNTGGGESRILQSGDGEFNQMIRTDLSYSFYPKPFYISGYSAFNNRTNNFSDEFRYGFDAGYTGKKINAITHFNVVESLFNGGVLNSSNGIFSNNTEYISPALELVYLFNPKMGISATFAGAIKAKNVLAAPSYGLGFYYNLIKH